MKVPAFTAAVIVTSRRGAHKRLKSLLDLIISAGMSAELVETPEDAKSRLVTVAKKAWCCVFVDVASNEGVDSFSAHHLETVVRKITFLRQGLSNVAILAAAPETSGALVIAAYRAGCHDFVHIPAETAQSFASMLQRASAKVLIESRQQKNLHGLRGIVEDFLRELVKTERRSIDLENELARGRGEEDDDEERAPRVVILEDDQEVVSLLVEELDAVGLESCAFATAEVALSSIDRLAAQGEPIDLALVDAKLPGADGLEAIRRIRQRYPQLAAILMTGYSDMQTAVDAADLGVVGYVLKPFSDIAGLVARIRGQAEHNRDRLRDQRYLTRIKERHDELLMRYRRLAADIDRGP